MIAAVAAVVLAALPATVLADCNGPACGAVESGLDAFGVVLLVAVLTLFVLVMTVGERVVRRVRRPTE